MARQTSTTGSSDNWKDKVKIASVPEAPRHPNRDYSPKGSDVPGLNEKVWKSYTTGETMVIGAPEAMVDEVRKELLKAKNYLMHIHRDDDPQPDIRGVGMEKTDLTVVTQEDIEAMDAKERTRYRAAVPVISGWVGVRFTARPPLNKGGRARQNAAIARALEAGQRKDATVRDIKSKTRGRAKQTGEGGTGQIPFSG